ncbi:sulfotransferase family protein [Bowmanella yangjiangensis]|uniref:Sulfotransferase n=1 Tax=Bowmanella yangjiangensis TaxID=2811230 RepID=A0ABS3CTJ4_9ALTE|nr:sulfotransferase [Bowmanella yangjiangensis]MBN7820447.1 sulfotransferase [Bowmanella yangjiangensis]
MQDTKQRVKLVNLHIIGVQKAGTTALASFLQQHPAVFLVRGKEAHIFDHPDYATHANPLDFARSQYQRRTQGYGGQPIICDATPITIYDPSFLQNCYQYNPDAKFILMLRDPVERAVSHYKMSKRTGKETRRMLSAFLLEPLRLHLARRKKDWSFNSPLRTQSYLDRGRYGRQLQAMFNIIPASQILIMSQEELQNEHDQSLTKIFRFLDIHRHFIPSETVFAAPFTKRTLGERLARLYARMYFALAGESPKTWLQVLNKASTTDE